MGAVQVTLTQYLPDGDGDNDDERHYGDNAEAPPPAPLPREAVEGPSPFFYFHAQSTPGILGRQRSVIKRRRHFSLKTEMFKVLKGL